MLYVKPQFGDSMYGTLNINNVVFLLFYSVFTDLCPMVKCVACPSNIYLSDSYGCRGCQCGGIQRFSLRSFYLFIFM